MPETSGSWVSAVTSEGRTWRMDGDRASVDPRSGVKVGKVG